MAKLKIDRKAYTRKAHRRKSYVKDVKKGRGVKLKRIPATTVKKTRVPRTRFLRKDIGAKGRSPRPKGVPKLKKGRMTRAVAKALGYEKRPTDLTGKEWKRVFDRSGISGRSWLGMLGTQVARRKYAKIGTVRAKNKKAFQKAISVLAKSREGQLIPREAIRKWSKVMTPRQRALAMPERGAKKRLSSLT